MLTLTVGARASPLSKAQVSEIFRLLQQHHSSIHFEPLFQLSTGDKDKQTSLRNLEKTDFFTKEIDHLVLNGTCRIGIHSAKDLPDPLPTGLKMIALTKGLNSTDALVMRSQDTLQSLKHGALIATSSERREEAVKHLRSDFLFCDLRGTISERLHLLDLGKADGVVVAEAALIRLGLTHLNRVTIPGDTVPMQGKLAILAKESDVEMETLFKCLDSR